MSGCSFLRGCLTLVPSPEEKGLESRLERFAGGGRGNAITVIEREDNVFLMLSREKLFAAIYPETSFALFSDFLQTELGAEDNDRSVFRQ